MFEKIKSKIENHESLEFSDAMELMNLKGHKCLELFAFANLIRSRLGDEIDLCSIINAKCGLCPEDCKFCAQSAHNDTEIIPYPFLDEEEIMNAALMMQEEGASRFCIVISGNRANEEDLKKILNSIKRVRKETSMSLCASLGMLTKENSLQLKNAGITRIHHNLETSEKFYRNVCSTHSYQERKKTIQAAKSSGLEVCCGGIIGMGESVQDRIELAFTLRELDVDAVPINILNPVKGTSFENLEPISPMDALKTIAVFRLILPEKNIRIAGGREKNLRDLQCLSLLAGANGLLLGNYLTTGGRFPGEDIQMIKDLGLVPGGRYV